MIQWQHPWQSFDKVKYPESYFLGEMHWELEPHPQHPLSNVDVEIVGWIPGYDHFILFAPSEQRYIHVELNWNKGGQFLAPAMEVLGDEEDVARFVRNFKK